MASLKLFQNLLKPNGRLGQNIEIYLKNYMKQPGAGTNSGGGHFARVKKKKK